MLQRLIERRNKQILRTMRRRIKILKGINELLQDDRFIGAVRKQSELAVHGAETALMLARKHRRSPVMRMAGRIDQVVGALKSHAEGFDPDKALRYALNN